MSSHEPHANPRIPITKRQAGEVKYQIQSLSRADMAGYTYQLSRSKFKTAKADLMIYDAGGSLVLRGRDFGDRTFYWSPDANEAPLTT